MGDDVEASKRLRSKTIILRNAETLEDLGWGKADGASNPKTTKDEGGRRYHKGDPSRVMKLMKLQRDYQ
ncbi:hypothetical protein SAY86_019842 [Trapa natans]|uniref:Uncharacterized protein n=1 Tax=Trapa natans TaxID=22666 RepID=A0AAN7R761_TRANT|nr:hypothetical protein SAY86_019842 [Trapa natans]